MKKLLFTLFLSALAIQCSIAQTTVQFIVTELPELEGKKVGVRGDSFPFSWEKSIPLEKKGNSFSIQVDFPESVSEIEFKFVFFDDDSNPTWESISNRSEVFGINKELTSLHQWNVEQVINISALPLIQPDELLADYKLIEQMILEVHPGTYRYNDEVSIKKELDELKEKFTEPLTHGEAYLAMAKLTASIQCDHTKPGFNNQNTIINAVIHGQPDKLPFTFKWFDGRMFVEYDATLDELLKKGDEVLSINGVSVNEIQRSMLPYIAADGATDNNRISKMEIDGYDFRYNAFDVFYPLLYPFSKKELNLEIIQKEAISPKELIVYSVTREERSTILTSRYTEFPKTKDDLWSFEITKDDVGVLEVNSFGLMGWKALSLDYKAFLKEVFEEINKKDIENLIIDIRKNNGGNDEMAVELFSYLDIKESVAREVYREGRTRYLEFPEPLKSNVQTWGDDPWYFNLKTDEKEGRYYIFKEDPSKSKFVKKTTVFEGNIYLLTSSQNTSLAYYSALNFKRHDLGTSIGQETGGNMRGINGGQILFLRLPNSGIEIDLSIMGGFVYGDQPNHGVKPNIEVPQTLDQFKKGEDAEMNAAFDLIRRN